MLEKILELVKRQLGELPKEGVNLETRFDSLDLDSIDIAEIIFALEDEFDITFDDDAIKGFEKMGDLVEYLNSKGIK